MSGALDSLAYGCGTVRFSPVPRVWSMNNAHEASSEAFPGNLHQSSDQILPLVYSELRKLAAIRIAQEAPGNTLQPTALVHEAWLRLGANPNQVWDNPRHFFMAAAEAMRRILIDRARRRKRLKRGGDLRPVPIEELELAVDADPDSLLLVEEALERFAAHDPEKAELIKLRFFVGLSLEETARVLGISEPTAKRRWAYARAWLFQEMDRLR